MKFRPLALLALLVITGAMPLVATAAACESMALCHSQKGQRLVALMPCCTPNVECAPEPATHADATAPELARASIAIETLTATSNIAVSPPARTTDSLDPSPPPPTRLRLARLATLLI